MSTTESKRVLVLGASGMLGNAMLRLFVARGVHEVVGAVRSASALRQLPESVHGHVMPGVDVENNDTLAALFGRVRPDVVINCVGLVKQLADSNRPLAALPINSLLPHRLAALCAIGGARLVHISTDCVFAGTRGMYLESDTPDAADLYGRSKLLGEVDEPNAVTLRTSIIGHELGSSRGLIGWFLAQEGGVRGYARAVFSGLPTVELATIIHDNVLIQPDLRGLYHVAASPIDKFSLLRLVARQYGHKIAIEPDDRLVIDRSLDSTHFRAATGYEPPDWTELVARMHRFG